MHLVCKSKATSTITLHICTKRASPNRSENLNTITDYLLCKTRRLLMFASDDTPNIHGKCATPSMCVNSHPSKSFGTSRAAICYRLLYLQMNLRHGLYVWQALFALNYAFAFILSRFCAVSGPRTVRQSAAGLLMMRDFVRRPGTSSRQSRDSVAAAEIKNAKHLI